MAVVVCEVRAVTVEVWIMECGLLASDGDMVNPTSLYVAGCLIMVSLSVHPKIIIM